MRVLILVCVVYSVVGQDINSMRDMPKYDTRYDYLDVDAVLDSKRLVRNYVECLINQQRCTPEGKALKRILPEALRTKCVRCTERQKRTAVKVIKRLKYEYPDEWAKLSSRWDPTGDFTRYFEEYLAKEQFNIIPNSGNDIGSTLPPPPPEPPSPPASPTSPAPTSPPARPAAPTSPPMTVDTPTETRPVILNRFGDDGELMIGSPSTPTEAPSPQPSERPTMRPTIRPMMPSRPTQMTMMWAGAASDTMPTLFPLRPFQTMPPAYTTAITFIDQLGYKIMRTTELVSDILRNTVRAVVG